MMQFLYKFIDSEGAYASSFETPVLSKYLSEHAHTPESWNRSGTEVKRFAKYMLNKDISFVPHMKSINEKALFTLPKNHLN